MCWGWQMYTIAALVLCWIWLTHIPAYCFDEACAYITKELEEGKEPSFKAKYASFSDMYKKYK